MPSIAYLDLKYDKSYFTNKIYNNAITLTALVNDCQIGFYISDESYIDLSISYDNGMTWTDIHLQDGSNFYYPDPIDAGKTIMVVGRENHHNYGCKGLHIFSEENNYFNVSGNLTSLLDSDIALVEREWPQVKSYMNNFFDNLFGTFTNSNTTYRTYIKDASGLIFPDLDPTQYMYARMFRGCTSLETAPVTLTTHVNSSSSCYGMFWGCSSLTTAPKLPATTLGFSCYADMFRECTSLTVAPELPATTLTMLCYQEMFKGCTSLVVAPRLNATTLTNQCYQSMFEGCTSLTTAPELPATTLNSRCYYCMFEGCTSLTTAPVLPATTLVSECYSYMFKDCENLNYIKILATSWPASSYLEDHITDWVENVAPTGIFVKDTNTTYLIDNDSGVPIGWTVYDVGEYIPQSYTITITVDPNGSGTVSGAGTYQKGSSVALIATPKTGYRFVGWYDHYGTLVSTNTMYTFTINRHEDFLAQFAEIEYYTVTLSQDPSIGATLTGAGTYEGGSTVTITASNVFGYAFVGWYNNGNLVSDNSTFVFTIDDDISLVAVYEEFIDYNHTYFTIEAMKDGGKFILDFSSLISGSSIQIKFNDNAWTTISSNSSLLNSDWTLNIGDGNLVTGDRLSLRRINRVGLTNTDDDATKCIRVRSNKQYVAYGNIASIYSSHDDVSNMTDDYYAGINLNNMNTNETYYRLFYSNYSNEQTLTDASNLILPFTTLANYAYDEMFSNCRQLTTPPELPATTLDRCCYQAMFFNCSLLSTPPELPATILADFCYEHMFNGCVSLTEAPELPATTLATSCYYNMFSNCGALTEAPELPATTLAFGCYEQMFVNSGLIEAPELPATTLAGGCYTAMFKQCTSLTEAPELPATTLEWNCYGHMFEFCSGLTEAPELPATTVAAECYEQMFKDCYALVTPPSILPADVLYESCYNGMFLGCHMLEEAPELPATTLALNCYNGMFAWCSSLREAPVLWATTLAQACYANMFAWCTSLTGYIELPATTLETSCYGSMFRGCTNVNEITCMATDISAQWCTDQWLDEVANFGTFTKNSNMTSWSIGPGGIPTGWTVQNAS